MLQISPSESFPIVRVLGNILDTDTNYVQATIRDASTDDLIATVNLDDKGDRRFQKVWKVTYDNAYSQGRFIVITTTVYSDSGYTTRNPNYFEQGETYLVQQRWNPSANMGGGGVIDYREIAKLVAEVLENKKTPIIAKLETPIKEFPTEEILKEVGRMIKEIPPQIEPEKIDFTPLEKGLEKVIKVIKEIPPQKETNLFPLISQIQDTNELIRNLTNAIRENDKRETDEIVAGIVKEINNGAVRFSLFGETNPFDNTKQKRENYLKMLANQTK